MNSAPQSDLKTAGESSGFRVCYLQIQQYRMNCQPLNDHGQHKKRFEDVEAWKQGRELTRPPPPAFIKSLRKVNSREITRLEIKSGGRLSLLLQILPRVLIRSGNREFVQFLAIARGSASELKSQLYTALDAGYVDQKEFAELYQLAHSVVLLIGGFIKYLQQSELSGQKFKTATQRKTLNSEL